MPSVIFTRAARTELIKAGDWYERRSRGLGGRFVMAVDAAVEGVRYNPRQFPIVYKSVRRALLQRFPYALMFVIEPDDTLTVIACFHSSRDPARWQRRS